MTACPWCRCEIEADDVRNNLASVCRYCFAASNQIRVNYRCSTLQMYPEEIEKIIPESLHLRLKKCVGGLYV